MQVVFVRHGERRRGESDPELTSAGRRMAAETGRWLANRGFVPALVISTPTLRTLQTADELRAALPPAPLETVDMEPSSANTWEALVSLFQPRVGPGTGLLMVGHHPTLHALLDAFGPTPVPVPGHHFAAALVLERDRSLWTCTAAWPGRAA